MQGVFRTSAASSPRKGSLKTASFRRSLSNFFRADRKASPSTSPVFFMRAARASEPDS